MKLAVNTDSSLDSASLANAATKVGALRSNLEKVIQGKSEAIELLVTAFVANGSILIEDVPGVGKTTLAKALAASVDGEFGRIQFTPDLLPADILGSSVYNPSDGSFTFRKGPIFCNVLLADEINRASPRTQSALLEAMSEDQATIEGTRRPLPQPFTMLATQNPIEFHGTYPLPEAQLDRFIILLDLGYPDSETEVEILFQHAAHEPIDEVRPVFSTREMAEIQALARRNTVEPSIAKYLVELVNETRSHPALKLGVSPRGSLMLFRMAQAYALVQGRSFVMPDDVQRLAPHVLSHRTVLSSKAKYDGTAKRDVITEIVGRVRVPS